MNTELQTAKPITGPELKAIHALWRTIDAGRGDERDSRTARLEWISNVVKRPVATTKDLSNDEALQVLEMMKQETGQTWKPRGGGWRGRMAQNASSARRAGQSVGASALRQSMVQKLGEMATDLWGERWNDLLEARLHERFRVRSLRSLSPAQARSMVEELLQRVAVRNIANRHQPPIHRWEIEEEVVKLRARYFAVGADPSVRPGRGAEIG